MSDKKQIASAFVKAQKGFAPALKTSSNPFFKSKYADLSACIEAVLDSLNNNGIAVLQHCHESDAGVKVSTVFLHESGESIDCGKLHVPASKNDPQGYGSALTYARRYSLMAACGIAPEDDDGNAVSKTPSAPAIKQIKPNDKNFDVEIKLLHECGSMAALAAAWNNLDQSARHVLLNVKDECKAAIEAAEKGAI